MCLIPSQYALLDALVGLQHHLGRHRFLSENLVSTAANDQGQHKIFYENP